MTAQIKEHTRRYMIGDKVRVTAIDRTGVVEAHNLDPEQLPYLVRLDPQTVEELHDPKRALYCEGALERNLSPAFSVVFEVGARDVYDRALNRLQAAQSEYVAEAADLKDAAERRAKASRMADSFFQNLASLVMRASTYDGVLHISPERHAGDCLSLQFWYEGSGYHGALFFHGERTGSAGERHPLVGEWSLNT